MDSQAHLDLVFGALADATRRTMLSRLLEGEATVNALVALTPHKQPTVSRHLQVLAKAGLVTRVARAQYRLVKLNVEPLTEALIWMNRYSRIYDDSLDRLETHLESMVRATPNKETP